MTIRYTCVKCGTVLKIQEDRVGKEKHCPKCKTSFIVPAPAAADPAADSIDEEQAPAAAPAKPAAEKVAAAKASSPAVAAPAGDPDAGDADFDPVAFLMTEGGAPEKGAAKRAVSAASEQPDMKAARGGPSAYVASDEPDVRVGGPRRPAAKGDDDDSAAELLNRKPKRGPTASAAQTADEMLRVNASTNAKELLTKTMEESRIRAAQMPEERKVPGIDYKETARELLLRFAPAVGGAVLLIVLAYWLGNLMMGGPPLPQLANVTGTVTKDGKPLVDAYVSFSPVDTQAGAGTAYTDENGYYKLKYTEGVSGAVIGKNRVEVSKIGPDGREMVPAKTMYGQGSNVIQVVEEGSQTIDIPIP